LESLQENWKRETGNWDSPCGSILRMFKILVVMLSLVATASSVAAPSSADLPTRKYLNLAAIKTMVAAAEAKPKSKMLKSRICIVDEAAICFFSSEGKMPLRSTRIQFAQRKARHAAFYRAPSKKRC